MSHQDNVSRIKVVREALGVIFKMKLFLLVDLRFHFMRINKHLKLEKAMTLM
jgi:hypothetical protein